MIDFKKNAEDQRKEWLSHVRQEVQDIAARGTPITWDEWQAMRLNSWEQEELYKHLDNEAFVKVAKYVLDNCSVRQVTSRPCATYDEAFRCIFAPGLIARLEKTLEM